MELVKREDHWALYNEDGHKIASTIDGCNSKLSIKNCQAIELGYDLDELVEEAIIQVVDKNEQVGLFDIGFLKGFLKALEILGDKKFSEEDMLKAVEYGIQSALQAVPGITSTQSVLDSYKQSLQQTEFDVEVEQELIQSSIEGEAIWKTKLDEDGCLILKRK